MWARPVSSAPCAAHMIRRVTNDGLLVDDSNKPEDYEGMYCCTDPDAGYAYATPPATTVIKEGKLPCAI